MTLQYRVPKTNLFAPSGNDTFAASDDSEPVVDWKKIRRARPLDELLPATQRWAAALPDAVRPVELLRAYPRIANRLALACNDPKAIREVLNDVLIDRRGGRRGFPTSVLSELLKFRSTVSGGYTLIP